MLTFRTQRQLNDFLGRKISPTFMGEIEFCIFDKFKHNRILFTAEHAAWKKLRLPKFGKNAYVVVGERNTDLLAKLAALHLRSAYLIPWICRINADPARDPKELGKGLTLFSRVWKGEKKVTRILIHRDKDYFSKLERYHQLIASLNPKAIISIHGMNMKRKFDLLLGFGKNYGAIGGKKNAFKFKHEFHSFLENILWRMGLKSLDIAVSTWLLVGSRNYVITRHIIEHNKKGGNRIGVQAEFNWKGRVGKGENLSVEYQVAVQALGEFMLKWIQER